MKIGARTGLIVLLGSMSCAWGVDWPQWRGMNRDGVWNEPGVLDTFPAQGFQFLWRAPCGQGWSSPVIANGRVYLIDSELMKPEAKERVRCFDETTGRLLWAHAYAAEYPEWAFAPEQGGGPTATPVVDAGRVFTVGACGHVHCLDAEQGTVIWEKNLRRDYEVGPMQCRPSPLIEGGLIIAFVGAKPAASVVALDAQTGREVWKALDERVSSSSPMVIQAGGRRQLIVWTDASVTSLDPASGRVWWREAYVTSNNDSIPTPVVSGDRLLISGVMFRLDPDKPDAAVQWPDVSGAPLKRLLSNTSTPMLRGAHVYSAKSSGELVCLEADTGRVVWKSRAVTELRSGASLHLTPCGDEVLVFTDRGDLIRARLSPEGYRELGRAHLLDPTTPFGNHKFAWAPPSYANGRVFARNDEELVCAEFGGR